VTERSEAGSKSLEAPILVIFRASVTIFRVSVGPADVALYLLKRHSGIVWGPGLFAGLLHRGDVRRLGNPAGAPALGLTPWRTWGCPTNCKIPLSKV